MREPTVYYHCWSHPGEPPIYKNLRTPIIPSIATLRAVSDVPIIVIDIGEQLSDWGSFPKALNFDVLRCNPQMLRVAHKVEGWRHLSRLFDLREHGSGNPLVYVDTDFFFVESPFPLAADPSKFCWNGWNTGFFYYDRNARDVQDFFAEFEALTMAAVYFPEIRNLTKAYCTYDGWYGVWDEMILLYMKNKRPELFRNIPLEDHCTFGNLLDLKGKPRGFHANGTLCEDVLTGNQHQRGLMTLLISEFYDAVRSVLSAEDMAKVYGETNLAFYEGKRVTLEQAGRMLRGLRKDKSLFETSKIIHRSNLI